MMPDTSRALGFWETAQALVHDMLHGHANIGYMVTVSGLIDEKLFLKGLESLFQAHPMLRGRLYNDEKGLYHLTTDAQFQDIPKSFCPNQNEAFVKSLYEEELYKPFDTKNFLWRAHLVHDPKLHCSYLVGSFSHAIGDGLSVLFFIQNLIAVANGRNNLKNFELLPPIEHMLEPDRFKHQSKGILEIGRDTENTIIWPFQEKDPGIENRKTGNIFKVMDTKQFKALQEACAKKSLTIHDALNAALILSLGKFTKQTGTFKLSTPVNLRKLCSPNVPADYFGCNITMLRTSHETEQSSQNLWSVAKTYHKKLRRALKNAGLNLKEFNLSDIMPYVKNCQEARNSFSMGFGITNMGSFNFDQKETDLHQIQSLYGAASRQAADFVSLISAITINDKMFLTFPYTKPLIQDQWMESLADYMLEILDFYSKGTSLRLTQAA